ncbi:GspH/FimT family pseudopilin [Caenimonas terrae]|uniref:Type II secretion system protein H n=1 Tax=Caenimonas terrae TaxID=696074 RepID=A0ABW0N9Y9_9BURK
MLIQRGFTLIELLITIAIVAILAALAAPSFKVMLANAQIRTAAQASFDGLQLARVEAIRRNQRVMFIKGANSSWDVTVESGSVAVQSRTSADGSPSVTMVATPTDATKVTFDGLGRVKPNTDASSTISQIDADVPVSLIPAASSRELRITISSGGAIRLCDPGAPSGSSTGC